MQKITWTIVLLMAAQAPAAHAAFWVAVGSFQNATVAARVVEEASSALKESFSIQQVDTGNGTAQRVVSGPFESRDTAQAVLEQAQTRGYPDSWIYSRSGGTMMVAAAGPTDESSVARTLNDDAMNGAGDVSAHPPADAAQLPTLQEVLKGVNELPTYVPPGYQLNQLYRDGKIPAPNAQR